MLNTRASFGVAMMGAALIKATLTLLFGLTFDPIQSGIAVVVFLIGMVLATSAGFSR